MPRIPLLTESSELNPEQRRVVDAILGKRGGRIPGPFRLALHCPEVTEAWHPLGEVLRLKTTFPLRLSEFAIIITARAWDCEYVFNAHVSIALQDGLAQSVVDQLAAGERPKGMKEDEEAIYDYCTELYRDHAISDATYARALKLFGTAKVVELTCLIGYYSMVAMTLLAHQMPLPDGAKPVLAKRR